MFINSNLSIRVPMTQLFFTLHILFSKTIRFKIMYICGGKVNDLKPHPNFYGDKRLLSKFPDEFIPYVTDAEDTGPESENRWAAYRYQIWFYDFKGDDPSRTEYLEAETLSELRMLISNYLKTGEIIHY